MRPFTFEMTGSKAKPLCPKPILSYGYWIGLCLYLALGITNCSKFEKQPTDAVPSLTVDATGKVNAVTPNYQMEMADDQMTITLHTGEKAQLDFGQTFTLKEQNSDSDILLSAPKANYDLRLYAKNSTQIAYDLIIPPGSSPEDITLALDKPNQTWISDVGDLMIQLQDRVVKHSKPYTYQIIDDQKVEIESHFLLDDDLLSFEVGAYDKNYELVIDPTVSMMLLATCPTLDYNVVSNKQMIVFTSTLNFGSSADVNLFTDGIAGNQQAFWWTNNQNIVNEEFLRMQFPAPTILNGIEMTGANFLDNNSTYRIEGSNDGSNWTDITGVQTFSDDSGAGIYGATSNSRKLPITGNKTAYIYYRIFGLSGQTQFNWVSEIFFGTDLGNQSGLANVSCNTNTTPFNPVDDYITFDLDPCGGTGTYTVMASGTTIAAGAGALGASVTASFGTPTTFRLANGSVGDGDVTITISGFTDNMSVTEVLTDPGSCIPNCDNGASAYNSGNRQSLITVTANSTFTTGDAQQLVDGNTDLTGNGVRTSGDIVYATGQTVWQFDLNAQIRYTSFTLYTEGTIFLDGPFDGTIQASNDGITWIDLTTPGGELMDDTRAIYDIPLTQNTGGYTSYRMIGTDGRIDGGEWLSEIEGTAEAVAGVTNVQCNSGADPFDESDDFITFGLDPTGTSGSYNLIVDGYTPSPAGSTFGETTMFTLPAGSAGNGDINFTIQDINNTCLIEGTIIDPGSCLPESCGGSDWNDPTLKSTITGTFHVPGTGDTEGPIARFVDSDESNFADSKNNDYTNEATFDLQFPEATVLTGIEVVVTGAPISSATVFVEASNDGINYVPLTNNLVFGTDFVLAPSQYSSSTLQGYAFPFPNNTTAYTHYRVFAIEMTTFFTSRRWNELYFDYNIFDEMLTNVTIGDNSTPGNFTDDIVSFDFNPTPGTGTYDVSLQGGTYTLTPSSGTYGQVSSFASSAGAAGTGELTVILFDPTEVCVQNITIANPDFSGAVVEAIQAPCANPTDNPLSSIRITADDATFVKAEYNVGTVYAGTGFASATDITNASSGFVIVNNLPNPQFDTYYTIRAYNTETLFRDYVVLVQPKVCSVADLQLSIAPLGDDSANGGEQLTYVVTLTNAGDDPALNVAVRVDIPTGLELLTTTPSIGDYSPGTQLWTADLVPVGTHQLTVTYRMK
ncbi:MAG: hypothetical protein AAF705_03665 [Bacteroidota bacterium]